MSDTTETPWWATDPDNLPRFVTDKGGHLWCRDGSLYSDGGGWNNPAELEARHGPCTPLVPTQRRDLAPDPDTVTVTTTCRVRLSDLVVPGFPGGRTLSAEASMPVDVFTAAP